jgi:hypothetical protein
MGPRFVVEQGLRTPTGSFTGKFYIGFIRGSGARSGAHRLAVDGDVTLLLAFGETHGAQRLRQRAPVDGAQGFGERRMTGRHAFCESARLDAERRGNDRRD